MLNKSRIAEISDQDATTWKALGDAFPSEAEHLFGILGAPMKIRAFTSIVWKALRKKGFGGTQDLAWFLAQSPRAWLEETFESPEVQATLGAWGMHLDFAPDIAGGALFPYLEAMANQSFGMVLGKGVVDTIVTALSGAIEAKGGQILCGHSVDRIVQQGGCATGVIVEGVLIDAKRAVIANVAPRAMEQLTGGSGQLDYDRSMMSFHHAPGTMMIHLVMSDLPDWTASEDLKNFAYVHIAPSLDQMALCYQQASGGFLPQEPVVVVGQPTAVDTSRAPSGQHILWIQVRMVPGQIMADSADQITATSWVQAAAPFVDPYVTLARTQGYSENQVILREALPNAVLPTLTLIGVQFTFLIGGTVIIERLFSYEGLGNMAIDAIINRDLPLIQGIVIMFALIFTVVNRLVDLTYA
ncbi:MAG: ABC transporter permease subunit, partial [Paracoccaceae bacterium]|nr:ABC transporter permease subunit [Paracoccaceae bacterium]